MVIDAVTLELCRTGDRALLRLLAKPFGHETPIPSTN
jgi:hypothetical protein